MASYISLKTPLWLALSGSITCGLVTPFPIPSLIVSAVVLTALAYWLLRDKGELRKRYLKEDVATTQALHCRPGWTGQPRLKDLGPGLTLIGLIAIYIAHDTSQEKPSTRTLKLFSDVLGTTATIAMLVFLGTFLLIRGIELMLGSRGKQ